MVTRMILSEDILNAFADIIQIMHQSAWKSNPIYSGRWRWWKERSFHFKGFQYLPCCIHCVIMHVWMKIWRMISWLVTWGSHVRKGQGTSRQKTRCPYDEVKYGVQHMYGFIPYPRVLLWPNTCAVSFSHSHTSSPWSATCRVVVPLSALEIRVITLSFYCLNPSLSLSIFLFPSFSFSFIKKQ